MNRRERRAQASKAGGSRDRRHGAAPAAFDARAALERAAALYEAGRHGQAQRISLDVLEREPEQPGGLHMLGIIAHARGDYAGAVAYLERAVSAAPDIATFQHNLAEAFRTQGQLDLAERRYRRAIELDLTYALAHNGLGNVLHAQFRYEEARRHFEFATMFDIDLAVGYANLGSVLDACGKPGQAVEQYERALSLDPELEISIALGNALQSSGQPRKAEQFFRRSAQSGPDAPVAHSNLLLCMNYSAHDPEAVFEEHRQWQERHAAGVAPLPPAHPDLSPDRRLRIGYVTADLYGHSVGYFFKPLLEQHDREAFEVTCYTNAWRSDGMTADWLSALPDRWCDTTRMTAEEIAETVRADEIDILIDLSGHTAHHRLLTFAYRPAPVQVTYCGYANTTGLDAIDYRLTDAWADPPGTTEAFHSETLVRLPGGFLAYQPKPDVPEPSDPPSLENGYVTFGSFNHLPKVAPAVIAVWSRILNAVPDSRFSYKALAFGDDATRERILREFEAHGVDRARIDLVAWTISHSEHLELYSRIDIALDTFPYAGTTTTCETLWMGVPIVTLAGRTHVARVGVSLLGQLGLEELVASDEDAFVEVATTLAADRERLVGLRSGMRSRMTQSPLLDGARIAREIEDAYRTMWHSYVAGE